MAGAADSAGSLLGMITEMRLPFTSKPVLVHPSTQVFRRFETPQSSSMTQQIHMLLEQGVLEIPDQRRIVLTHFQSKAAEPIHCIETIQTDFTVSHLSVPSEGRVDGKIRPLVCLLPRAHRSILAKVSETVLQPSGPPNDLSAVRTVVCTQKLCSSNWVAQYLRNRGRRIIVYLDDFLLGNQSRTLLQGQKRTTIETMEIRMDYKFR